MEFFDVVKNRYSCKKFDGRQVDAAQLKAILEAGRLAPTAKNLQEQKIYVVQSAQGLAKIDAVTPCRYGAPTVLIVAFEKQCVRLSWRKAGFRCGRRRYRGHAHDAGRKSRRRGKLLAQLFRPGSGGQGICPAGK